MSAANQNLEATAVFVAIFVMVLVMYLYTAHIPIRFMAVNNSIIGIGIGRGGEIGRQLVKAPLAVAISP